MEQELKNDISLPIFIFSPVCMPIVESVLNEMRPKQISQQLRISEQKLNYWLRKLENNQILVRGIKTSYQEWLVNPSLEHLLKQKISEFKAGKRTKLVKMNFHHCLVKWPIKKADNIRFGVKKKHWRGGDILEEQVEYNGLRFKIELTSKNFIVKFPAGVGIQYIGFKEGAISGVKGVCFNTANAVKDKFVKRFKERLVLGEPQVKGHYAKQSYLAHKLTRIGITFTAKGGNKWVQIDKSSHFSPKGEIETNKEETAQAMVEFPLNYRELNRKVELCCKKLGVE